MGKPMPKEARVECFERAQTGDASAQTIFAISHNFLTDARSYSEDNVSGTAQFSGFGCELSCLGRRFTEISRSRN